MAISKSLERAADGLTPKSEGKMRFKARCRECPTEIKSEKRKLFGIAVRRHEAMTGHEVRVLEAS